MVTSSQADVRADAAAKDLGPLAWVLDETRKSIESANKSLKRFAHETSAARGVDIASVDASRLRLARQQLHQAVGALEMVEQPVAARMVRGMEAAVQQLVQHPDKCDESAAATLERAGFALVEYLESQLGARERSSVGLFPQYRQVQELAGADRIHPADLWPGRWRWIDDAPTPPASPLIYGTDVRNRIDQRVLKMMRHSDASAASELAALSLGLASGQPDRRQAVFWKLCGGFFETLGQKLAPMDIYAKRAASRVLLQYVSLARGEPNVSERLALDLLFFCAQARPFADADAPALAAVRKAWALDRYAPVDYEQPAFGLYDPALLAQARRRVDAVKENWSALAGGDLARLRSCVNQFDLVTESLDKLHEKGKPLSDALKRVAAQVSQSGRAPSPELAMETATAVLFLEASFADFQPGAAQFTDRMQQLADRLDSVRGGAPAPALKPWMEDLYRGVSDRQTMGTVVGELRITLGEIEQHLDQFFRDPSDKSALTTVSERMGQMRGVLSVLGLEQAALAVGRMNDAVSDLLASEASPDEIRASGIFDRIGNSLGALGFQIDMMGYQPMLARTLFVYDEESGELRHVAGRALAEGESDAAPTQAPPSDAKPGQRADDAASNLDFTFNLDEAAAPPASEPGEDEKPSLEEQITSLSPLTAAQPGEGEKLAIEELPGHLEQIAAKAALEERPALAKAAQRAADAAREGDHDRLSGALEALQTVAQPKTVAPPPPSPAPAASGAQAGEEDDLLDIFLEEAREVVHNGKEALRALQDEPGDLEQQTTLRRAFHTLKGSSRMVGLAEFGEAAWAMEQMLNAWLAEQKPVSQNLRGLAGEAMDGFARWIDAIAGKQAGGWSAAPFRETADALRTQGQRLSLAALLADPAAAQDSTPAVAEAAAQEAGEPPAAPIEIESAAPPPPPPMPPALAGLELPDLNLLDLSGAYAETVPMPLAPPPAPPAPESAPEMLAFDLGQLGLAPPPDTVTPPTQARAEASAGFDLLPADLEKLDKLTRPEPADAGPQDREPPAGALDVAEGALSDELLAAFESPTVSAPLPLEPPSAEPPPPAEEAAAADDEMVKQIGDLRISAPLYNVYLNEADEWSRQLVTELSEWALELHRPVPELAIARAHSLAGSSATVGFMALSELARAIEHALQRLVDQRRATAAQLRVLGEAADEIRRVLHQFAAGIMKLPGESILADVRAIEPTEPAPAPDSQAADLNEGPARWLMSQPAPLMPLTSDRPPRHAPAATAQPAAAARQRISDDIQVVDAVDPDLFSIFEEEAEDLLPRLSAALRQWAVHPDDRSARGEVMRALHTLKGSARLAGAMRLGEMAHRTESAVEVIGAENLRSSDIEPLLDDLDQLLETFHQLQAGGGAQAAGAEPLAQAPVPPAAEPQPAPAEPEAAPPKAAEPEPAPEEPEAAAPVAEPPAPPAEPAPPPVPVVRGEVAAPAPLSMVTARAAASQAVRVRSQLLDRLVNQAGEVLTSRARLETEVGQLRSSLTDLTSNLDRLRQQLRDVELQAETQMQSRMAQSKDAQQNFDPLEFDRFTRMQELTRMMAESVNDVATVQRSLQGALDASENDLAAQARQSRELQRDLLRTRMVEFDSVSERLYRVVRQASKEIDKQVRLDIVGGSIEVDRGILERMTPAFEHLLRNSVVHGIELPAARVAAGKDPSGAITISVHQAGNDVSIEFRDDGAGLDLTRLRERAEQQGRIAPGQTLSEADLRNLVFVSGLSTMTKVTELAGRGVGMDVVRTEVRAIGGRIEIDSTQGKGSSFRLILPLTTAVTHVVMVRAGGLSVGVPSNLVEIVRRVPEQELAQAYATGRYRFGDEEMPFYWSGALLQSSVRSTEPPARTTPVVVFRSADQHVALHVDEVLGNQEVVVKALGPQLARLPGLVAITALASGAVALIYNPVVLASVYGEQARAVSVEAAKLPAPGAPTKAAAAPRSDIPLVLVVDDSITVRRVTQRLLQREGYRVALAVDGLQGLEQLQIERPAVVLSDIEMPRMDGFDFVRNIRADEKLRNLPVIMITSRIASKHRDHAMELGIDHYLGKPYAEEELLELIKSYAQTAAAPASAA